MAMVSSSEVSVKGNCGNPGVGEGESFSSSGFADQHDGGKSVKGLSLSLGLCSRKGRFRPLFRRGFPIMVRFWPVLASSSTFLRANRAGLFKQCMFDVEVKVRTNNFRLQLSLTSSSSTPCSLKLDVVRDPNPMPISDRPNARFQENDTTANSPKPTCLQMEDNEDGLNSNSLVTEFDPEVISSFRKSLEQLSLDGDDEKQSSDAEIAIDGDDVSRADYKCKEKEKLILYFTSLRGVRKTYEDCCHVRAILKGLGKRVDERDLSIHSGFKEELKELLKDGFCGGGLPRVFVGKKCIGGAEEIRILHEDGQLEKLLECCESSDGGACQACGDVRFVPCATCSGSCKVFDEEEYGFQPCTDCNENGIIRCPVCCD